MSTTSSSRVSHHGKALAQGVLVTSLWSTTFVLAKAALADLPPLTLGGLIYLTAFLGLLIRRLLSRERSLRSLGWDRKRWYAVALLGLLTYALVPAALCLALAALPAVTFNFVFQAAMPITVGLLAGVFLGERTSRWQWLGIGTLVGGLFLFLDAARADRNLVGVALAALTGAGVGLSNLIARSVMRDGRSRAADVSLVGMGLGSLTLLAVAAPIDGLPSLGAKALAILLWVGLINTAFAFTLWNHVLRTLTALEAGVLSGLQVVMVVAAAHLLLGERLAAERLPAAVLILAGVAVVHLPRGLVARLSRRPVPPQPVAGRALRVADIIAKKRDGGELSPEEIERVVLGYTRSEVPDEQAAAWCMAVFFRGMTLAETSSLTEIMAASGGMLRHDGAEVVGDKHSTGGVGDTTTLVMGPMVAAAGLPLAKVSGRGLAFTAGTVDKLEAIPGCRVELPMRRFEQQLAEVGLVVVGPTPELAPADARLYALRAVTGTVPAFPLMASSIMSKKIVSGAHTIVLDVKTGGGAFVPERHRSVELASLMMGIGRSLGRRMTAVIGGMDQPLGLAVGHSLEVAEAIETLQGRGPADLRLHCTTVAGELLRLAGFGDPEQAHRRAAATLDDGSAWLKFRSFVGAQGGDLRALDDPSRLPRAPIVEPLRAPRAGFVAGVDARAVGMALLDLGGGRARKEQGIDHAVGVVLTPAGKVGAQVEAGEPLLFLHARSTDTLTKARQRLCAAFTFAEQPVAPPPVVVEVLR